MTAPQFLFILAICVAACILIWLITKPKFWLILVLLLALAAFFSCLASIIHFQIFWAVAYFLAGSGLSYLAGAIAKA